MRVLHVVSVLSDDGSSGGPARVAVAQASALIASGGEAVVIGSSRAPNTHHWPPELTFKAFKLPGLGTAGVLSPRMFAWFVLNFRRFDRVHVHLSRDLVTLPIALFALTAGRPGSLILQTHGMIDRSDRRLAAVVDGLATRRVLRRASRIALLTSHELSDLQEVAPRLAPTVVVPNSVDIPTIPITAPRKRPEIVFLARMHKRKRPDLFVDMAVSLLERNFVADFALVGPDEGAIAEPMEMVARRHWNDRVVWEGPIDAQEVYGRLAGAFLYVLPAEREPFGLTIIEALAVGIPVVVARDAAIAGEIVAAGCGSTFDGSLENLCEVVSMYLSHPELRAEHSRQARRFVVENYSNEALPHHLGALYA